MVIDPEKLDEIGRAEWTAHDKLGFRDQRGKRAVALLAGADIGGGIIRQFGTL